jgi:hypothetical protein
MSNITDHRIISHEEWIEQRKALLWGGSHLWEDRLRARIPWRSEAKKS